MIIGFCSDELAISLFINNNNYQPRVEKVQHKLENGNRRNKVGTVARTSGEEEAQSNE